MERKVEIVVTTTNGRRLPSVWVAVEDAGIAVTGMLKSRVVALMEVRK